MDDQAYQELKAQAFAIYEVEVQESLDNAEKFLLQLEDTPDDDELINAVFRDLHTIKGSSGMNGVENVAAFVHYLEDAYDRARDGKLKVDAELIDVALKGLDYVRQLISAHDDVTQTDTDLAESVKQRIKTLLGDLEEEKQEGNSDNSLAVEDTESTESADESMFSVYHIKFVPGADLMFRGINLVGLLEELAETAIHHRIVADTTKVGDLKEVNPESISMSWQVLLATNVSLEILEDVFMFVVDDSDLKIEQLLYDVTAEESKEIVENLFVILDVDLGVSSEKLGDAAKTLLLEDLRGIGSTQETEFLDSTTADEPKLAKSAQQNNNVAKKSNIEQYIRVPADRLDRQLNLVGELVIAQSTLTQFANEMQDSRLTAISETIEQLTSDLRDNSMNLRMLQVGNLFNRYKRVVRDISSRLGKKIRLVTEGDQTELDKTVIDKLGDPLVHIIRNSADHGIESPEDRLAAEKPEEGAILLTASHEGANVVITIQDDGKGLDRDVIREKAEANGLLSQGEKYTDNEIYRQILEPGFSTAAEISDLSGRGVGMDVVKKTIESLSGTINIESTKGVGTILKLHLPLTLAIIDGLLVDVGGSYFVIPLGLIDEVVELQQARGDSNTGRNIINIRDRIVPYVYLRDLFEIEGERGEIERIVIVSNGGKRIGLVVDLVVGKHQTVIKGLSKMYENVGTLSGATILGDGSVALILDVPELVNYAEREEQGNLSTVI